MVEAVAGVLVRRLSLYLMRGERENCCRPWQIVENNISPFSVPVGIDLDSVDGGMRLKMKAALMEAVAEG